MDGAVPVNARLMSLEVAEDNPIVELNLEIKCMVPVAVPKTWNHELDELVQERRNSSALAMELRLSCTNPSNYGIVIHSFKCPSKNISMA